MTLSLEGQPIPSHHVCKGEPITTPFPQINRVWAMPNHETFQIKPIRELVDRYLAGSALSVDPFARASKLATITNDLDPKQPTDHHMTCEDFARHLKNTGQYPDLVLFDPPYSTRQVMDVYQGIGRAWLASDNHEAGRWTKTKDILTEILADGGHVISFGWSTTGFGKKRGFMPVEYLLVNHAGAHNDTIVTVERKSS